MRVLFFITVVTHGRGGHGHSLNHIATALGEKVDIGIYSVGSKKSEVISKNPFFKGHCFFNVKNYLSFKRKVNEDIKEFNPDIIHCFDDDAYNVLSLFVRSKYRMVVNKCGGPNPPEYPIVRNLVLFSKENQNWFEHQKKFRNTSIYLIPNRVNKKELVIDKSYRPLTKKDAFCFVRIARIGETYKKSIEDSIRLLAEVKNKGAEAHLYIIGTVEDETVLSNLKYECKNLPVTFVTENEYTAKASNMLYLADAVIATGRGIMEATGLGKPILTPAQNSMLPILVNQNNFDSFLATNFSQRNVAIEDDIQPNINNIRKLIDDKQFYERLKKQSKGFFDKYFDVQGAVPKYIQVYNNMLEEPKRNRRAFVNIKCRLKSTYYFYIKGR